MRRTASQTLFAHVVGRADIELDVAALLIGDWDRESMDLGSYTGILDQWAHRAHAQVAGQEPIWAINRVLFDELSFRGNHEDYYDPRNSFLADVLQRRVGIPITLSVVYIEVARRMGVEIHGVAFPGHFLVRYDGVGERPIILDPFRQGMALDEGALHAILHNVIGAHAELTAEMLQPATKRQILLRMLTNLAVVYDRRADVARALEVLERILILDPANEAVERAVDRLRAQVGEIN